MIVKAVIAYRFDTFTTSVPFPPDRVYAPVALTPFDGGIVVVVEVGAVVVDVVVVAVVVVVVVVVAVVVVVVVEVGTEVEVADDVVPALAHAFGAPYLTGVAPIGAAIMTFPESSVIAK
ncbi:MAG TPA: hypothetical protein VMV11_08435 [Acidimicrobiales bacterium]|nr:hypothetical protein [Acidimicrobiales bacterium]